jgi:signal transduction histidine kinase
MTICILVLLNLLTAIFREMEGSEYTIHTKKLLFLLIFCLLNVWFSYKKHHVLTKFNLIITPSLILVLLPIFCGEVQESDFIYAPLLILGISFIPPLILHPKLTSKLYLLSFFYFLVMVIFIDDILVLFSSQDFNIVTSTADFHFYYKLVFITSFVFIQSTMYYLRNINYNFENELISINDKLSESINELKATQAYLIQSEKMASLGTLAAGIAHEINNPLNFIQGGTSFIETYIKDNFPDKFEEVQPVLAGINTGVIRAAAIVHSLNQYNSSDTLPFSNCNLHSIIDDCLVMLQNQYKYRIDVQKRYTDKYYTFEGNEGKLHQAFLNILANASQSIGDHGKVTILTNIVNKEIHIVITDNGHGMSEEILKKVFDPFFTTKDPGKGIGLGLTLSYNTIKEHKGTIELESQIGVGTTVIIKLPLKIS